MARTCYICGARTRNVKNLTCGYGPCKTEHLRRHPELRKKWQRDRQYNPNPEIFPGSFGKHTLNRIPDERG